MKNMTIEEKRKIFKKAIIEKFPKNSEICYGVSFHSVKTKYMYYYYDTNTYILYKSLIEDFYVNYVLNK